MDKITKPLHKDDIPENKDPGPYWDPSRPLQKPENQDLGPYKNWKTGTRHLCGTQARPYKNRKTRTQNPSGTQQKLERRILVGPYKNWKTRTWHSSGTLQKTGMWSVGGLQVHGIGSHWLPLEKDQSRVSAEFVWGKREENGQRDLVRAEHFLRWLG